MSITSFFSGLPGVSFFLKVPVLGDLFQYTFQSLDNLVGNYNGPTLKGPRLDDLGIAGASEGAPIAYCDGPEAYVRQSQMLWAPDKIEIVEEEEGGKGGGGKGEPDQETYHYFAHGYIGICEGPPDGLGIVRIRKGWAGGKLLYNSDPPTSASSALLTATKTEVKTFVNGVATVIATYLDIGSPSNGPDLSVFQSGINATTSGFANGGNNGTFRVLESYYDVTTNTSRLRLKNSGAVTAGAGPLVTITQTLPVSILGTLTPYLGTSTQGPSALIESYEGAGEVPGYRFLVGMEVNMLALEKFGNQFPMQWAFLLEIRAFCSVGSALGRLLERTGRFTAADYDVTQVTGEVRGMTLYGPDTTAAGIKALMIAHDVLPYVKLGKLYFADRDKLPTLAVDPLDLAAFTKNARFDRPMELADRDFRQLPSHVNVDHLDPSMLYETGQQSAKRIHHPVENNAAVDLRSLVLSAVEARQIAERLLWTAHANRQAVALKLPASYVGLVHEGLVLTFAVDGEAYKIVVTKVDRGANFMLDVLGFVGNDASFLIQGGPAEDAEGPDPPIIEVPGEMLHHVLDIAPFTNGEALTPIVYHAAALADPDLPFQGAVLYQSGDGGATYFPLTEVPAETPMGWAKTALASSSARYWDRKSTVDVEMADGVLESAPEIDVLNGVNLAVLGGEVIGFATATLISARTYRLSTLLRGLRDTYDPATVHSIGDRFILLKAQGIATQAIGTAGMGLTKSFKAVPAGGAEADFEGVAVKLEGNTIRPFSPCSPFGSRHTPATDDWTVTLLARTRALVRIFQKAPIEFLEPDAVFQVKVYADGTYAVLKRTITATATGNGTKIELGSYALGYSFRMIYDKLDQEADFSGAAQSTLHLEAYQVSQVYGPGRALRFSVTQ